MADTKDLVIDFRGELISNLEKENKKLKQKNEELKQRLAQQASGHNITPEELVCIEQIEMLKVRSAGRELSLEEIKKLDLLIKNLRLIKEQSTANVETPKYRDVSEDALVRIAAEPES